jgi:hypothetical protein
VMLDVWLDVEVRWWGGGMLEFVKIFEMSCKCEESECCVLCDRDYSESYRDLNYSRVCGLWTVNRVREQN